MSTQYELAGDFQVEVLDASSQAPIVVDFWAEWCGPCRMLGPVLEKLAGEAAGRWRLVKVDTEAHPEIAGHFGIRSIPTVMLFQDGQVIDTFMGALPEDQITAWLDAALGAAPVPTTAETVADPADEAKALLRTDPARARELADEMPEGIEGRDALLTLGRLLDIAKRAAADEIPGSSEAKTDYLAGAVAYMEGDDEEALGQWIAVAAADRTLDDDGARRAAIAVFTLAGHESELTQTYRRKLSSALF
jgi:putative thioredoxin